MTLAWLNVPNMTWWMSIVWPSRCPRSDPVSVECPSQSLHTAFAPVTRISPEYPDFLDLMLTLSCTVDFYVFRTVPPLTICSVQCMLLWKYCTVLQISVSHAGENYLCMREIIITLFFCFIYNFSLWYCSSCTVPSSHCKDILYSTCLHEHFSCICTSRPLYCRSFVLLLRFCTSLC